MVDESLADVPAVSSDPAILVVDDNRVKRISLRAMLSPLGCPILEAESGRDALQILATQTFALILMDVRMPILNGFETAKLCRAQGRQAQTPIIFVTAMGGDEREVASAYESGAVDFIFTPVLPDVLRAKAAAFIELYMQSQQLQRSLESITALHDALRESDVRTQAVLDTVSDGIFILDEKGNIESINSSVSHLFGYRDGEPVGHSFAFMIAPDERAAFPCFDTAGELVERGSQKRTVETLGCRHDGSTFAMEVERSAVTHGERRLTVASVRDISERKAHTEVLEHLAVHDALTGLANRTLFGDLLSRELASAKRNKEQRAVLMVDLDGFKNVNDTLGHDRGDTLLKRIGKRLVSTLREGDTVARLGGDEFGILPAGPTDLSAAAGVALKIKQTCERGFQIDGELVHVAPSIGISLYPEHGRNAADLLHRADLAMYSAKRSGEGHAIFDSAQETQTANHLALLVDLRHCVSRDELVLHFQPQVDLRTREICGMEALVRWRHPTQGLLPPSAFIEEVERTHLIGPLTRWVLNAALRQQRAWRDVGLDLTMAVNVSARSLVEDAGLPEAVAEFTALWDTAPGRLTLELTESALIGVGAPVVLKRLHEMGHRLSIDDFGTGYSSLVYLQRLPLSEIKIDRSFIMNLADHRDDAIIVRSTIDLAHSLGLTVVAEGVEDAAATEMLLDFGCDSAQGYLFARPSAAADLELPASFVSRPSLAVLNGGEKSRVWRAGMGKRSDLHPDASALQEETA